MKLYSLPDLLRLEPDKVPIIRQYLEDRIEGLQISILELDGMSKSSRIIEVLKDDLNVMMAEVDETGNVWFTTRGDPTTYRDPLHRLSNLTMKRLERYGITPDSFLECDEPGCYNENTILLNDKEMV